MFRPLYRQLISASRLVTEYLFYWSQRWKATCLFMCLINLCIIIPVNLYIRWCLIKSGCTSSNGCDFKLHLHFKFSFYFCITWGFCFFHESAVHLLISHTNFLHTLLLHLIHHFLCGLPLLSSPAVSCVTSFVTLRNENWT